MGHGSDLESVIVLFDCDSNIPASEMELWFQNRGWSTLRTDDIIHAISLAMDECGQYRPDVVLLETNHMNVDFDLVTELSGMFSCGRRVRVRLFPNSDESGETAVKPRDADVAQWPSIAFS